MAGQVHLQRLEEGIVRVLLDHEKRLNAIGSRMWGELQRLFQELSEDDDLRCILITGAGERAFSTGADISEFEETRSTADRAKAYAAQMHGALAAVRDCRHPVVAQIRGLCVGGGLETALCTDLRVAGQNARFGIPIKRLGLVAAYEEMAALIETVGRSNALRILLEGDIFGAQEAFSMGLVTRVVPDEELEAEALATAKRIAEGAPLVARWHKKFARRLLDPRPLGEAEREEGYACFETEDFRIGYQAFLEKKKPQFRGR